MQMLFHPFWQALNNYGSFYYSTFFYMWITTLYIILYELNRRVSKKMYLNSCVLVPRYLKVVVSDTLCLCPCPCQQIIAYSVFLTVVWFLCISCIMYVGIVINLTWVPWWARKRFHHAEPWPSRVPLPWIAKLISHFRLIHWKRLDFDQDARVGGARRVPSIWKFI